MDYSDQERDLLHEFYKYKEAYGERSLLEEFDESALSLNSPAISFYFAELGGMYGKKHADIVLKSKDLNAIYELSSKYPKLLKYVLDSHDFDYNFKIIKKTFNDGTLFYHGSYVRISKKIERHVNSIIESPETDKLVSFLEWFFKNISVKVNRGYGIDNVGKKMLGDSKKYINSIIDKIVESNNVETMYKAFKVVYRQSYTYEYDYNKLLDSIAESKNAKINYLLAEYFSNHGDEEFKQHDKAIIDSGDPEYNYKMLWKFENSNHLGHLEAIIRSKNSYYNYLCIAEIPGANKVKHLDAIVESEDFKWIFLLALKYPDESLYNDYKNIITSTSENYISRLSESYPYMFDEIKVKIKELKK